MLRNNWLSRLCIGLGLICILLAAALGIYNLREDNAARQRSDHVLAALRQEVSSTEHEGFQPVWQLPEESTPQMRTVNIDGYDYIGYLSFPTLDTELPVMSGWSKAGLKIAPGRYYGSVYTGDLVIAGHNYRTGFGKLKLLRQGDPVLYGYGPDHPQLSGGRCGNSGSFGCGGNDSEPLAAFSLYLYL